jgi:hypothetical protein
MGIFSKIKKALNPLDTNHPIGNPGGFILGNVLKGTQSGDSVAAPAAAAPVDPSGGSYYGDPNDPAYGSFTQPFDVEQFYNYADPGYAFELQQGTQALQNSAAAQSGALSGAALKDLLGYSQNFARTGYNDAFNRYQTQQGNIFSRLSSIAQLGQNAAAGVGSTGANIAGNAGQAISNAGGAAGAGIVGAGNSLGNGLSDYWLWKNYGGMGGSGGAPITPATVTNYRVS